MPTRPPETTRLLDALKHGLAGDGTRSDSAAAQTFLAAAAAANAIAYFPPATYRLSDVWTPSNTWIIFAQGVTLKIPTSGVVQPDPCTFRLASSDRTTGWVTNIRLEGAVTIDYTDVANGTYSAINGFHLINVDGFSTERLVVNAISFPTTSSHVYMFAANTAGKAPKNGIVGGGSHTSVRGIGCGYAQLLGATNVTQRGAVYVDGGVCWRNEMDGNSYTSENVHAYGPFHSDGASGFANTLFYFIPHGNKMRNMSVRNGRATGGVHGVKTAYDAGNTPDSLDGIYAENIYVTGGGQLHTTAGTNDIIPRRFVMRNSGVSGSTGDGVTVIPGAYKNVDSHDNTGYGFAHNPQPGNYYPRRYTFDGCQSDSNVAGSGFSLTDAQGVTELRATRSSEPHTGSAGPNLLSTNQAGLESSTSGWGVQDANTTIAQSAAQAQAGSKSLSRTRTSTTGAAVARTTGGTGGIIVTPSIIYTGSAYLRAATTTRSCFVTLRWFDGFGTQIVPDSVGSSASDSNSAWTLYSVSGTAPTGAVYANLMVTTSNCPAAEIHYSDTHAIQQASVAAVQNYGMTVTGGTVIIDGGDYASNVAGPVSRSGGTITGTFRGSGSPEGVVVASVGSTYRRSDGTANTSLYVKEANDTASGWVAK